MNGDEVFTGFEGLDTVLGGYRPGTLNVIAGRPGMGKTALALSIAKNAARDFSRTVLYFSLEVSRTELVSRFALQNETCRSGCESLNTIVSRIGNISVYFDDSIGFTPDHMAKRVRCLSDKTENGIDLIIIDYFGLVSLPEEIGFDSKWDYLSMVSHRLKELAGELNKPILLLTKIHRNADFREKHIPKLTDLRLSSALDQDADSVVFLVRPHYYDYLQAEDEAQLIIAKNNYGNQDVIVDVLWNRAKRSFTEPYSKDRMERETMAIFKSWLVDRGLYNNYIFLDKPTKFKVFFKDDDSELVKLFCAFNLDHGDSVMFCGSFKWIQNRLITLDGEKYNEHMTVFGYSRVFNYSINGEELRILAGDDY